MKVALCCIAKQENNYIKEWVEYNLNLGFDKIFIYDNNEVDYEPVKDILQKYIDSSQVELIDIQGQRGKQLIVYKECYDNHKDEYDWIAFFDVDEFLTFQKPNLRTVQDFVSLDIFSDTDSIKINWLYMDDNDLLENDGRPVLERFTRPAKQSHLVENIHIKSIVRGGLEGVYFENPHCAFGVQKSVLESGVDVEIGRTGFKPLYVNAYIRHFGTKTISEFCRNKKFRTLADGNWCDPYKTYDLKFFFDHNEYSEEKVALYNKLCLEHFRLNNLRKSVILFSAHNMDQASKDAYLRLKTQIDFTKYDLIWCYPEMKHYDELFVEEHNITMNFYDNWEVAKHFQKRRFYNPSKIIEKFWKKHQQEYEYYYIIEWDVYFTQKWGDLFQFLDEHIKCDFLSSHIGIAQVDFGFYEGIHKKTIEQVFGDIEHWQSFNPITRLSNLALETIWKELDNEPCIHDVIYEIYWPIIMHKNNLSMVSFSKEDLGHLKKNDIVKHLNLNSMETFRCGIFDLNIIEKANIKTPLLFHKCFRIDK